jgi:hypothetical protein
MNNKDTRNQNQAATRPLLRHAHKSGLCIIAHRTPHRTRGKEMLCMQVMAVMNERTAPGQKQN